MCLLVVTALLLQVGIPGMVAENGGASACGFEDPAESILPRP